MNKTELLDLLKLNIIDVNNEDEISDLLKLSKDEIKLIKKDKGCAKYYYQILVVIKKRPDLDFIKRVLSYPWEYLLKDFVKIITPEHLKSLYIVDILKMVMQSYEYDMAHLFMKILNNDEIYYNDDKSHYILKRALEYSNNKPLLQQFICIVNDDKLKKSNYYDFIIEESRSIKYGSSMECYIKVVSNDGILNHPSFKDIVSKYINSFDTYGYVSELITNEDVIKSNKILKLLEYANNIEDTTKKNNFCTGIVNNPQLLYSNKLDVVLNIGNIIVKSPNVFFKYYMKVVGNEAFYNTESYIRILTLLSNVTDENVLVTFNNIIYSSEFYKSEYFNKLLNQINTITDLQNLCKRKNLICDSMLLNSHDGKLEYALLLSNKCDEKYLSKFIQMAINYALFNSIFYKKALETILEIYKNYGEILPNLNDLEDIQSLIYNKDLINLTCYLDVLNVLLKYNSSENLDYLLALFKNKSLMDTNVYFDIVSKAVTIHDRNYLAYYKNVVSDLELLKCDCYADFIKAFNNIDFLNEDNTEIINAIDIILDNYYGDMFNEIIKSIVDNPTKDYIVALCSVISFSDNVLKLVINDSNYKEIINNIKYLDDLAENNYNYQFIRDYMDGKYEYSINTTLLSIATNPDLVQLDNYQSVIENIIKIRDKNRLDMISDLITEVLKSSNAKLIGEIISILNDILNNELFNNLYNSFKQDSVINYSHLEDLLNLLKENKTNVKNKIIIECLFNFKVLNSLYYTEIFNIVKNVPDKGVLDVDILNVLIQIVNDSNDIENDFDTLLGIYVDCYHNIEKNITPILARYGSFENYINECIKNNLYQHEKLINIIKNNYIDIIEKYLDDIPDDAEIDENTILKVRKK